MRGAPYRRSKTSWSLVFRDASNKQKWATFTPPPGLSAKEAKKAAEAELARLVHQVHTGTFIDAATTTLLDYVRDWHAKAIVPMRRPSTARVYKTMIDNHVAPAPIAHVPLQKVRPSDLEAFYASLSLAPSSVHVVHAMLGRALKMAVRDRLIAVNPAPAAEDRPRVSADRGRAAREHCWTATDAQTFLAAAQQAGPQAAAFYTLAVDSGARRSELAALLWTDVDWKTSKLTIARQLDKAGDAPVFGPTKTGKPRTVTLGVDTMARLKTHRAHQRELMMANRKVYRDLGLMFAHEHEHIQTPTAALGQPLPTLGDARFHKLVEVAGVKPIKFHGLRHTCATLLLAAGVPVQVVAARLGHAQVNMTLEVYAHATPDLQQDAAAKLGAVLAGR